MENEIRNAIKKIVEKDEYGYCAICTIESVDLIENTCYCIPINGDSDLMNVKLIANNGTGFLIIPVIGSNVIVSLLSDQTAYVSMFSEVDKIIINGGAKGGLVNINDLKTQLASLQNAVDTLKILTGAAITVYSSALDGGASATTFNSAVLPQINFLGLEDTNVTH